MEKKKTNRQLIVFFGCLIYFCSIFFYLILFGLNSIAYGLLTINAFMFMIIMLYVSAFNEKVSDILEEIKGKNGNV